MKKCKAYLSAMLALTLCLVSACAPAAQESEGQTPAPGSTAAASPSPAAAGKYAAGTYSASGAGMNGDVAVTVVFSADEVLSVEVGEHSETQGIGTLAIDALPEQIVAAQGAEVEAVSGATITSKAILSAVKKCIAQAMGEEQPGAISYTPGTYHASSTGMCGPVELSVTFSGDKITAIDVTQQTETLTVGTAALDILSKRIVETQSLGVDTVSGATVTSMAILSGVKDCVEMAGGSVDALMEVPAEIDTYRYDDRPYETKVLVVGGGLAGIMAAHKLMDSGTDFILIDQKEFLGGNSTMATGTLQLGGTSIQANLGLEDSADKFYEWILSNSDYQKDPVKARAIADNGQALIDYFAVKGVKFNEEALNNTDNSDVKRGHSLSPSGKAAISHLIDLLQDGGADIRYATKATELITNAAGEVIGVKASNYYGEPVEYYADAVVLATGGFGNNNDMIVKYWGPDYDGLSYGGAKGMDGTMMNAAVKLGAALVDMDDKHVDATHEVTRRVTLTSNLLANCGGILIRQSTAQRFADEPAHHCEDAADLMHELGDPYYYEIFDDSAMEYLPTVAKTIQGYFDMGLPTKYESIEEMAQGLDVDLDTLTKTIEDFNAAARGEMTDEFGRDRFFGELEAPYYVMKVANGVACTTGGLKTDEQMRVMTVDNAPIPNLYAVGEVTGGYLIHYVGGDALSLATISGMLVGEQLSK